MLYDPRHEQCLPEASVNAPMLSGQSRAAFDVQPDIGKARLSCRWVVNETGALEMVWIVAEAWRR